MHACSSRACSLFRLILLHAPMHTRMDSHRALFVCGGRRYCRRWCSTCTSRRRSAPPSSSACSSGCRASRSATATQISRATAPSARPAWSEYVANAVAVLVLQYSGQYNGRLGGVGTFAHRPLHPQAESAWGQRLTRSLRGPHRRRAHCQHRPRSRAAAVPAGARGGGGGDGRLVGRPRRRDGLGNVAAVARVQGAAACGAAAAGQARVHGALAPIARSEDRERLAGLLEASQMPPRPRGIGQSPRKLNGSAASDHAGTSGCASFRPTTCYTSSKRRTAPRLSPRFASSAAATWAGWEVVVGR